MPLHPRRNTDGVPFPAEGSRRRGRCAFSGAHPEICREAAWEISPCDCACVKVRNLPGKGKFSTRPAYACCRSPYNGLSISAPGADASFPALHLHPVQKFQCLRTRTGVRRAADRNLKTENVPFLSLPRTARAGQTRRNIRTVLHVLVTEPRVCYDQN